VADEDKEMAVPKVASDALCLGCHRTLVGRPRTQPQIVPAVHTNDVGEKPDMKPDTKPDGCVGCHKPHWPKTAIRTKAK
jgi:hypothetical protein